MELSRTSRMDGNRNPSKHHILWVALAPIYFLYSSLTHVSPTIGCLPLMRPVVRICIIWSHNLVTHESSRWSSDQTMVCMRSQLYRKKSASALNVQNATKQQLENYRIHGRGQGLDVNVTGYSSTTDVERTRHSSHGESTIMVKYEMDMIYSTLSGATVTPTCPRKKSYPEKEELQEETTEEIQTCPRKKS